MVHITVGPIAAGSGNINLPGGSSSSTATDPNTATAGHQFNPDGEGINLGGSGDTPDWHLPNLTGIGSQYEIFATLDFGDSPDGAALDTWLPLSTTRSWFLHQIGPGSQSGAISISIRRSGTAFVIASGQYSMQVLVVT